MTKPEGHTALPWRIEPREDDHRVFLTAQPEDGYLPDRNGGKYLAHVMGDDREANAALIVRAVNCHEDLVKALESVVAWKDAIGLVCPDLGGLLTAIYTAESTLSRAKEQTP